MKKLYVNIAKQNEVVALSVNGAIDFLNLPINIIILLGINLILSLIIIIG